MLWGTIPRTTHPIRRNMRKKRRKQNPLSYSNNYIENYYVTKNIWRARLYQMAQTCITWKGIADKYSKPIIETFLINHGMAAVFKDENISDELICLPCCGEDSMNIYGIPCTFQAWGQNGYIRHDLVEGVNCVIIRNTPNDSPSTKIIEYYSERLTELSLTWVSNLKATKHPVGITARKEQALSVQNAMEQVELGKPYIFLNEGFDLNEMLSSINTGAPFLLDKLSEQIAVLWSEWLTYLGVPSMNIQKQERLLKDEVAQMMGGAIACRTPRMETRREAVENIHKLFNKTDVQCWYTIDKEPIPDLRPDSQKNADGDGGMDSWRHTPSY